MDPFIHLSSVQGLKTLKTMTHYIHLDSDYSWDMDSQLTYQLLLDRVNFQLWVWLEPVHVWGGGEAYICGA